MIRFWHPQRSTADHCSHYTDADWAGITDELAGGRGEFLGNGDSNGDEKVSVTGDVAMASAREVESATNPDLARGTGL